MENLEGLKTAENLIYLVSCAVNETDPDPNRCAQMDLAAVMELADRQMLSASAAYALKRVMPLDNDWKERMGKSIRWQVLFDLERGKLLKEFEDHGIWYLPLKGIVMKDLFPVAAMREMGDNDILCDGSKRHEIKSIMSQLGFTCIEYGESKHDVYKKAPLTFEIHNALFDHYTFPELHDYFASIKERLIKDADNLFGYHMTDEDFYIFLVCHLYKHDTAAGTGLRSLLDVYVFNNRSGGSVNREYIASQLDRLAVKDFEEKIRKLAEKAFSFTEMSDAEWEELTPFIDSDCYGSRKNVIAWRLGGSEGKEANKKHYLYRRFIPDEKYLKEFYPTVYRHRILYPFLIVYRPFKGLVTKRKKLYKEYKEIKEYKE